MYRCLIFPLFFVLVVPLAQSQSSAAGSIQGAVTDQSGAAVPSAVITLKSDTSEAARSTTTDRQGKYAFSSVSAGSFVVSAEGAGFAKATLPAQVTVGQSLDLSFALGVSALRQSVTVTAEPASVTETPTAQTLTTVDRRDFKDSPNLNISEAFALIPGVTTISGNGPRDVSVSVRGSNDRQTFGIRNAQVFEDGFPLTSHWNTRDILPLLGAVPIEQRVVEDRNRITGGGVTSGIDFGLVLAARLSDDTYAKMLQLINEYDPHPPFQAGTPAQGGSALTGHLQDMLSGSHERSMVAALDARKRLGLD